jgi:hypothetical protein
MAERADGPEDEEEEGTRGAKKSRLSQANEDGLATTADSAKKERKPRHKTRARAQSSSPDQEPVQSASSAPSAETKPTVSGEKKRRREKATLGSEEGGSGRPAKLLSSSRKEKQPRSIGGSLAAPDPEPERPSRPVRTDEQVEIAKPEERDKDKKAREKTSVVKIIEERKRREATGGSKPALNQVLGWRASDVGGDDGGLGVGGW